MLSYSKIEDYRRLIGNGNVTEEDCNLFQNNKRKVIDEAVMCNLFIAKLDTNSDDLLGTSTNWYDDGVTNCNLVSNFLEASDYAERHTGRGWTIGVDTLSKIHLKCTEQPFSLSKKNFRDRDTYNWVVTLVYEKLCEVWTYEDVYRDKHVLDSVSELWSGLLRLKPFDNFNHRVLFLFINTVLRRKGYEPLTFDRTQDELSKYMSAVHDIETKNDGTKLKQLVYNWELNSINKTMIAEKRDYIEVN